MVNPKAPYSCKLLISYWLVSTMLNIAIYDASGTMKRVTKGCYLFCSIDAKPVESGEYFYFLLKQNLHMLRVLLAQDKHGLQQVT